MNELANQKGVVQRARGWKLQLFSAEFDALVCIFRKCCCLAADVLQLLLLICNLAYCLHVASSSNVVYADLESAGKRPWSWQRPGKCDVIVLEFYNEKWCVV